MKKLTYLIMITALLMITRFAFAEEMKDSMTGDGMEKGMMMDKGMMGGGMMKMMGMQGMMGKSSMVASSDGGVIVLVGNKLYKYDQDLNLVKEAEIKVDMEAMKKMCPMCGKMMKDGTMDNDNDDSDKPASSDAVSEKSDHEIHH